jgi:hypothetical protein
MIAQSRRLGMRISMSVLDRAMATEIAVTAGATTVELIAVHRATISVAHSEASNIARQI